MTGPPIPPAQRSWPLMALAAAFLFAAAAEAIKDPTLDGVGVVLTTAGLVCLGAFIALESRRGGD